jgi:hypothetical protein
MTDELLTNDQLLEDVRRDRLRQDVVARMRRIDGIGRRALHLCGEMVAGLSLRPPLPGETPQGLIAWPVAPLPVRRYSGLSRHCNRLSRDCERALRGVQYWSSLAEQHAYLGRQHDVLEDRLERLEKGISLFMECYIEGKHVPNFDPLGEEKDEMYQPTAQDRREAQEVSDNRGWVGQLVNVLETFEAGYEQRTSCGNEGKTIANRIDRKGNALSARPLSRADKAAAWKALGEEAAAEISDLNQKRRDVLYQPRCGRTMEDLVGPEKEWYEAEQHARATGQLSAAQQAAETASMSSYEAEATRARGRF